MKCRGLTIVLTAFALALLTTDASAQIREEWSGRRAETVSKGRWEVGIFAPLRYGLTDDVELAAHPLAFFVVPNLTAKVSWTDDRPWRIGTRHGVHYPTPLLRMLSREGSGGILPADTEVPHIIAITNEVLATTTIPLFYRWVTVRLGVTIAPNIGGEEVIPPIELPVVFPRTAAYSSNIVGHAGIGFEGKIVSTFYLLWDGAVFFTPGFEGTYAFESTLEASWRPSDRFMLSAGARGILGGYPYGERYHVVPVVDAKWGF